MASSTGVSKQCKPAAGSRSRWNPKLQHREKFTTCLRNNIREYGRATAFLKEMLANADDAKASHFVVCLDKSQYPVDGLLSKDMAPLQGTSLWVGNSAKFSSADWHRYTQDVGDSGKVNDSETIGKFGKGALTAYGLTDVIQILSGDHLMMLDPHGEHLPDHQESIFGNLVDPEDEFPVDPAECPGQLDPFLSFTAHCPDKHVPELVLGRRYDGTLFRLALRSASAAKTSQISSEFFTADKVSQILRRFSHVAPGLLLFTRHVKSISVYQKDSVDSPCTLLHQCSASKTKQDSVAGCHRHLISVKIHNSRNNASRQQWMRCTHSAPGRISADTAVLLQDNVDGRDTVFLVLDGQVYSTLTLPLTRTQLPLHINGAFMMSSDRRTLRGGEGAQAEVTSRYKSYAE